MDKNKSLSPLERYLEAKRENKDLYMDTFEIETLLNYLEDNDNLMYYEEIVKLGLKLHPGNFYMRTCLEGYDTFRFDKNVLVDAYDKCREVCGYER